MRIHRAFAWPATALLAGAVLIGCGAGPSAAPATLEAASSPTPTFTPSPTLTPTPAASATPAPDLWPTPTLIALPTPNGAEQPCVQHDKNAKFSAQAASASVETAPADALAYLNAGGDPQQLEPALTAGIEGKVDGLKTQVLSAELTGDAIPEVTLALTFSIGADQSAGDTILVVFHCAQGQYQMETVFERAGAGARSAGLYAGGGARVLGVLDMNGSGRPDLVFASLWDEPGGAPYAEYGIGEWDGSAFQPLIRYTDVLGNEQTRIAAGWDVSIKDTDGDGKMELVFPELLDPSTGDLIRPAIFAWNGVTYQLKTP